MSLSIHVEHLVAVYREQGRTAAETAYRDIVKRGKLKRFEAIRLADEFRNRIYINGVPLRVTL